MNVRERLMACLPGIAGLVLLRALAPVTAHADDGSAAAFGAFGLEGVWSPDCRRPPSRANPRVLWRVPVDGPIFHGVTFDGVTWAVVDTVSGATILSNTLIRISSVRSGKIFSTATVERVGDRIHATNAVDANGKIYVKDGIDVTTGKPTLSDEQCDVSIPVS